MSRYTTTVVASTIEEHSEPAPLGKGVAEAIRVGIADAIRALPGNQWDRTGHLVSSLTIALVGDAWEIRAPSDRLETPEIMARFVDAVGVSATNPLASPAVQAAIDRTLVMIVVK